RYDFQPIYLLLWRIGFGDECHAEAKFCGLLESILATGGRADFTSKTDFAKSHHAGRQWLVTQGGKYGQQHGQVSRWFGDLHPADSIHEDILIKSCHPRMAMQHCEQHGQARTLQTHQIGRASCRERLDTERETRES